MALEELLKTLGQEKAYVDAKVTVASVADANRRQ